MVRRTARCGNVDDGDGEPHPCGGSASGGAKGQSKGADMSQQLDWKAEYAYAAGMQAFIYGFPFFYNA